MKISGVGQSFSPKRQCTDNIVSFSDNDVKEVQTPHNDAIIVSMTIAKYDVKKILIDNKSSADILFYDTFQKINMLGRLKQVGTQLIEFFGDSVAVEREVTLPVTTRNDPQ